MATKLEETLVRAYAPQGQEIKIERLIFLNNHLQQKLDAETWNMVCEASEIAMDVVVAAMERRR